ncbi:MAG TPA: hypothetical protein VLG38_03270 [Gammaproteobacteria bacterium]|nr:hypothetical protein [Gammaproteobacteria bacterium]
MYSSKIAKCIIAAAAVGFAPAVVVADTSATTPNPSMPVHSGMMNSDSTMNAQGAGHEGMMRLKEENLKLKEENQRLKMEIERMRKMKSQGGSMKRSTTPATPATPASSQ